MAYSPGCIPVVAQKNCEPELSYILAELSSMCMNESCFSDFGMSHLWYLHLRILVVVPAFKNAGGSSTDKNFFLWLVKSLKNL